MSLPIKCESVVIVHLPAAVSSVLKTLIGTIDVVSSMLELIPVVVCLG
jgi:hypothetical protein